MQLLAPCPLAEQRDGAMTDPLEPVIAPFNQADIGFGDERNFDAGIPSGRNGRDRSNDAVVDTPQNGGCN